MSTQCPDRECEKRIYGSLGAKLSRATFWSVFSAFIVIAGSIIVYTLSQASSAGEKAAATSERVARVETAVPAIHTALADLKAELRETNRLLREQR